LVSFFAKWYRAKRLEVAMRQYFLVFGLFAGAPVGIASDDASVGNGMLARQDAEAPVRIDTGIGAFLIREGWAEEFRQVLTGAPTEHHFYAGDLIVPQPDARSAIPR